MSTVLVTGASGFVGRAVCATLRDAGWRVTPVWRRPQPGMTGHDGVVAGDITAVEDWRPLLEGHTAVVHLAAVTHSGGLHDRRALEHYRAVNVSASRHLARQARDCGVPHFVFMSSIKVNGESTLRAVDGARAFGPDDVPAPEDNYGRTKLEAERELTSVFAGSSTGLTIIRPPLVYGPGQRGNMQRLLEWVRRGWPLPLGEVDNRRSLVYSGNLAHAVLCSLLNPCGAPRCVTLADVTLSTPDLVRALAVAMGVKARLFRLPRQVLLVLRAMPPTAATIRRLSDSLEVDSRSARERIGWSPPVDFETALEQTVNPMRREPR